MLAASAPLWRLTQLKVRDRDRRAPFAGALLAVGLAGSACGDDGPSWPAAAAGAVVVVDAQRCDRPNRLTGFGVRLDDGVIVTAAHNVDHDLRRLSVDGQPASVAAIDARADLAVLDVPGDEGAIAGLAAPTAVGRSQPLWLATVGDDGPQVSAIDGTRPTDLVVHDTTAGQRFEREAIAFTPAVAAGTSGAPLLTADGDVAGIVVIAVGARDRSYAVAAAEVASIRQQATGRTLERPPACA